MKKLIVFFSMFFFMLCAMPVLAATADPGTGNLIEQYFVSLAALAGAVLIVTQFVLKLINLDVDQLISWIVALVLSAVGWFLQLGILAGLEWYWIFIYGLASGLVANGIFDVGIINAILNYLLPKAKNQGQ